MTKEEAIKKLNAIKKYLTAGNPIWDVREIDEALNMAIKALEELPKRRKEVKRWKRKALQAEPKHGKWIKHEEYDECSLCHELIIFGSHYCPNCGAKMVKEWEE